MSKEFKHYELKASKRPAARKDLLTTVAVEKNHVRYYCYVSFSEKLVEYVGKRLSRGVSEATPAYLFVQEVKNAWYVVAAYVDRAEHTTLWKTDEQPGWLRFYQVNDHG